MRKWAFIVAVIGIFVLVVLMQRGGIGVSNAEELEELETNQKVHVAGAVVGERVLGSGQRLLFLEDNLTLVCECTQGYKGKSVEVEGIIEEFNEEKQIRVLKIKS